MELDPDSQFSLERKVTVDSACLSQCRKLGEEHREVLLFYVPLPQLPAYTIARSWSTTVFQRRVGSGYYWVVSPGHIQLPGHPNKPEDVFTIPS